MKLKFQKSEKNAFNFFLSFQKETFAMPTTTEKPHSLPVFLSSQDECERMYNLCAMNYLIAQELPRKNFKNLKTLLRDTMQCNIEYLYDMRFDIEILRTAVNCGMLLRMVERKPLTQPEKDMFIATISDMDIIDRHKQAIIDNLQYL
jgi:hypothetical protein